MARGIPGNNFNPSGRPKGVPNKATILAREAISRFVDNNVDKLNDWLNRIAAEDPDKAFDCFMSVVEYHIPKLARSELTGKDGTPLHIALAERISTARKRSE